MSMRDKETSIKFAILVLLQLVVVQLRAQITGQVLDAEDGYPVPYANVGYEGTNHHVQSDADGHFTIERRPGHVLVTSSVGYKAEKVKVRDNTSVLTIKIKSETTNMAEVEVRGRRKRYNRKENPAVALMRRVIEAKKLSDLENHPFYQFTKYQKITLARNDIDTTKLTPGKWYSEGVEKSDYNGKYVLPLTMSEVVTHHLYSKDPRKVRDMIVGQHSQGLNKLLQTGEMINTMLKGTSMTTTSASCSIPSQVLSAARPSVSTISIYRTRCRWRATVAITSVSIPPTSRTSVSQATFTS